MGTRKGTGRKYFGEFLFTVPSGRKTRKDRKVESKDIMKEKRGR